MALVGHDRGGYPATAAGGGSTLIPRTAGGTTSSTTRRSRARTEGPGVARPAVVGAEIGRQDGGRPVTVDVCRAAFSTAPGMVAGAPEAAVAATSDPGRALV